MLCRKSSIRPRGGTYDAFMEKSLKALKAKPKAMGDSNNEDTQLSPLLDQAQYTRVGGFIKRGQVGQGKLLMGGPRTGEKVC